MVYSVAVALENVAEQSFAPRPFGGGPSQIILNTTSFSSIIGQLNNVAQSRNAQEGGYEPGPLSILSTGCFLNATSENAAQGDGTRAGDGFRDCAAACSQPGTMFNSSYTFWNCLTLAAASVYVEEMNMIVDDESLAEAGAQMGFDSLDSFNATQIFDDTLQCIKGSCENYNLGSCSTNITFLDISGAQDEVLALWSGLQGYCGGMESVVNSDIAGPGVRLTLEPPEFASQTSLTRAAGRALVCPTSRACDCSVCFHQPIHYLGPADPLVPVHSPRPHDRLPPISDDRHLSRGAATAQNTVAARR